MAEEVYSFSEEINYFKGNISEDEIDYIEDYIQTCKQTILLQYFFENIQSKNLENDKLLFMEKIDININVSEDQKLENIKV